MNELSELGRPFIGRLRKGVISFSYPFPPRDGGAFYVNVVRYEVTGFLSRQIFELELVFAQQLIGDLEHGTVSLVRFGQLGFSAEGFDGTPFIRWRHD